MRSGWLLGLSVLGAVLGANAPANVRAEGDKAAAQALFDDARKLMADGQYAQACPKLEASQRLDPGIGTMLNLADCYEKSGRTASAWAQFKDTAAEAHKAGSLDREEIARSRARELEAKLSYLTIVTWQGQQVLVKRDGATVDAAVLGTPIPVDPGPHVIAASAQGKRSWSTTVDVPAAAGTTRVAVPILPDESAAAAGVQPPAATAAPAAAASAAPGQGQDDGSTQRILAGVAAGVGLVGVAIGTVFGLKASSDWDDAKSDCNPYPKCGPQGDKLSDRASDEAMVSTVGFVVGAAGLAGGAILWFTAPDGDAEAEPQTAIAIGPGSVLVHGRF